MQNWRWPRDIRRLAVWVLSMLLLDVPSAQAQQELLVSSSTNEVLRYDRATGAFLGAFVTAGSGGLAGPPTYSFVLAGGLVQPRKFRSKSGPAAFPTVSIPSAMG